MVVVVESFLHLSVLFTLKGHSKKQRAFWVFFLSFIHFLVGERERERERESEKMLAIGSPTISVRTSTSCNALLRELQVLFSLFFFVLVGFYHNEIKALTLCFISFWLF